MKLPAFWSAVFFIAGILIGRAAQIPDMIILIIAGIVFAAGLVIYLKDITRWAWLIAACALFAGGFFRISLDTTNLPDNHISRFNDLGKKSVLKGAIVREPDLRPERTYLILRADTIVLEGQSVPVSGLVLLNLKETAGHLEYGEYLELRGFLTAPRGAINPGMFDYQKYLANKKIRSIIYLNDHRAIRHIGWQGRNLVISELVIPLRRFILEVFDEYLQTPQKYLIAGFLIGRTRFIPEDLYQQFRDTGTLHLLAVSGSNVALVIATVELILLMIHVPARARHLIDLVIILLFCLLSYSQPSVVRASVMISLYLLGHLACRQVNYVNIIAVAAILILLFEPLMLWDVGFQLSFAATFGLVYCLPLIYKKLALGRMSRYKIPAFAIMTFLSSVVAQVAVAPILAVNFHNLPLIGFISNLAVVPLASLSVIISLLLIFLGWLAPVARIVAPVANQVLAITISVVRYFADVPAARIATFSPGLIFMVLYYLAVIAGFQLINDLRKLKYLILITLLGLNLIIWDKVIEKSRIQPSLTILDCGDNFGVCLASQDGKTYLLNDLDQTEGAEKYKSRIEPFFHRCGRTGPDFFINSSGFRTSDTNVAYEIFNCAATGYDLKKYNCESFTFLKSEFSDKLLGLKYIFNSCEALILLDKDALSELYLDDSQCITGIDCLVVPWLEATDPTFQGFTETQGPKFIIFSSHPGLYGNTKEWVTALKKRLQIKSQAYAVGQEGAIEVLIKGSEILIKAGG